VKQFESGHEQIFVLAHGNGGPPRLPSIRTRPGSVEQTAKDPKHDDPLLLRHFAVFLLTKLFCLCVFAPLRLCVAFFLSALFASCGESPFNSPMALTPLVRDVFSKRPFGIESMRQASRVPRKGLFDVTDAVSAAGP
jgi:hypothetical protein